MKRGRAGRPRLARKDFARQVRMLELAAEFRFEVVPGQSRRLQGFERGRRLGLHPDAQQE